MTGIKSVGLLGVRNTMEGSFYPEILKQHGIDTIIPDEEEKTFIHETIINELVENDFRKTTRDRYIGIIRALHSRGAQGVILGCTEIPLLLSDDDVDVKTFSTTEIHCRAAVKLAIET
jgi:aspartate racemase